MPELTIQAKSGPASCPLCSESLAQGIPTRACSGCQVGYHASCFEELGGCATLGCAQAGKKSPAARPRAATPSRPGSSQPPLVIGVLVVLVLGVLLAVAFKSSTRSAPAAPTPRPAARRGSQEWGYEQRKLKLVDEVLALAGLQGASIRPMPTSFYDEEGLESARQRFRALLAEERESLTSLRGDLLTQAVRRRGELNLTVLRFVFDEVFEGAEED